MHKYVHFLQDVGKTWAKSLVFSHTKKGTSTSYTKIVPRKTDYSAQCIVFHSLKKRQRINISCQNISVENIYIITFVCWNALGIEGGTCWKSYNIQLPAPLMCSMYDSEVGFSFF